MLPSFTSSAEPVEPTEPIASIEPTTPTAPLSVHSCTHNLPSLLHLVSLLDALNLLEPTAPTAPTEPTECAVYIARRTCFPRDGDQMSTSSKYYNTILIEDGAVYYPLWPLCGSMEIPQMFLFRTTYFSSLRVD